MRKGTTIALGLLMLLILGSAFVQLFFMAR